MTEDELRDRYLKYHKAIWDSFEDGSDPVQNVLAVANKEAATYRNVSDRLFAENARLRTELAAANKIAHQNLWHYRNLGGKTDV